MGWELNRGKAEEMKNRKAKQIIIPEELFNQVTESAIKNDRSTNKEIISLLKKGLAKPLLIILLLASCSKPSADYKIERISEEDSVIRIVGLKEIKVRRQSTIANDFNNPGCIRNGNAEIDALAIGYCNTINGKFLVFDLPQHGFQALQLWVRKRKDWTLAKAIKVYAPQIENNTDKYISDICKGLSCNRNTKLSEVNEMQLISKIAEIEGFNK